MKKGRKLEECILLHASKGMMCKWLKERANKAREKKIMRPETNFNTSRKGNQDKMADCFPYSLLSPILSLPSATNVNAFALCPSACLRISLPLLCVLFVRLLLLLLCCMAPSAQGSEKSDSSSLVVLLRKHCKAVMQQQPLLQLFPSHQQILRLLFRAGNLFPFIISSPSPSLSSLSSCRAI